MNHETDLGSQWLQAWRLRQKGKDIINSAGVPLTQEIEEELFKEADERLDSYFEMVRGKPINIQEELAKRRGINKGVVPE